jgi:flagellar biosynthesis anti-sigma factor FlgM
MGVDSKPSCQPQGPARIAAIDDENQAASTADQNSADGLVQRLKSSLAEIADLRQEKITLLRQSISNGTFKVSPERIAEALLSEADRQHRS